MNTDTIVFLGPSLNLDAAKEILPNACYHAPIKCGDIIKIMRLKPKTLVIIDGFFEQTAAVWHKEILYALSSNVNVIGASSMGALRASELADFGMIGCGKIFELYKNNITLDDDEVALVHSDNYESTITPLVNVRFTLKAAIKDKIIDQKRSDQLFSSLKKKQYFDRSLFELCKDDEKLSTWLSINYIDQKSQDAISALELAKNPPKIKSTAKKPDGLFFTKIYRETIHKPFDKSYSWLPQAEKDLTELHNSEDAKYHLQLAKLIHINHDIACQIEHQLDNIDLKISYRQLFKNVLIYHNDFTKYNNGYSAFSISRFRDKHPQKYDVISKIVIFYQALLKFMNALEFEINLDYCQLFTNKLRQTHQLLTPDATYKWIADNKLHQKSFDKFIIAMAPMHYIVDKNNVGLLGIRTSC